MQPPPTNVKDIDQVRLALAHIRTNIYPNDWKAYTVTWSATTGDAPAIGNGTLEGWYFRNAGVCMVQIRMLAGATTTFGTGGYWRFSLPVDHALISGSGYLPCGSLMAYDDSVSKWYPGVTYLKTVDGGLLQGLTWEGTTAVGRTIPITFAQDDLLYLGATYPVGA